VPLRAGLLSADYTDERRLRQNQRNLRTVIGTSSKAKNTRKVPHKTSGQTPIFTFFQKSSPKTGFFDESVL
jgi:hypothetical protein